MAKIIIEGVFAVTNDNADIFFDLWDSDYAQPQLIVDILRNRQCEMRRVDHADEPFYPDEANDPTTEMWVYEHPVKTGDAEKMIGLYVDVIEDADNKKFNEFPRQWLLGQTSAAVVVYKKACCPEYSVLLCGSFEDGFDYRIKDDLLTHDGQEKIFEGHIRHDKDGSEMKHALSHIKGKDHSCNHGHKLHMGKMNERVVPAKFVCK